MILPLAADCPTGVDLAISVLQVLFCVVLVRSAGGRWWSSLLLCVSTSWAAAVILDRGTCARLVAAPQTSQIDASSWEGRKGG